MKMSKNTHTHTRAQMEASEAEPQGDRRIDHVCLVAGVCLLRLGGGKQQLRTYGLRQAMARRVGSAQSGSPSINACGQVA